MYCAPTIAMAVLETTAHIDDAGLPLNRFLIEIDVPADAWRARQHLKALALPPTWDAIPAGRAGVNIGSTWVRALSSAILLVASAIIPEENAALINPLHPDAKSIGARAIRRFEYNRLLRT